MKPCLESRAVESAIQITSRGGPKFVAGKTPSVKPRPYARFSEAMATNSPIVFGRDNPTRASSEAASHDARLANDWNPATFWQAGAGDTNAWLRADLERIVTVNKTALLFPRPWNWRYKIEISDQGDANWKLLADETQATARSARIPRKPVTLPDVLYA